MTEALANRIVKRLRHLRKWARRRGITSFRVYERDIPDWPLVVDWYDGDVVTWIHERTKDDTPEEAAAYERDAVAAVAAATDCPPNRLHVKYRRRQRGLDQYERLDRAGITRIVEEHGLKFEVNLSDYVDTGLFLDHRPTRVLVREAVEGMVRDLATGSAGCRVLNLFAYTGSFTCAAIAGGASSTTTVDMSRTYLDWCARNFEHNGFPIGDAHALVRADCLQWLDAAHPSAEERPYDIIVCDPPTFSNSKRMAANSFAIERDYPDLLAACAARLSDVGTIVFSTNARRFSLDGLPSSLVARDITDATLPEDARSRAHQCWLVRQDA